MEIPITKGSLRMIFILLGLILSLWVQVQASPPQMMWCPRKGSRCFGKKIWCPKQCPTESPRNPWAKVCYVDCDSPICKAECRSRKPNCNGYGAACMDPRFIGGDGIVFYFHGKSNEHFSLVTDSNLQINARFIGLRPAGRSRDYTWIQALGILFAHHMSFTLEATKAETWDNEVDHLKFTYDGKEVVMPEEHQFSWTSPSQDLKIERTSNKNSAMVTLAGIAEIKVNVVPITEDDNRVHNYQIPSNDCFAHLELQFRFFSLSREVEGVLGKTYQPDFENPAKPGVAMPVVGGEDKYRTSSLLSADCKACAFSPEGFPPQDDESIQTMDFGTLDCTGRGSSGNGVVCTISS